MSRRTLFLVVSAAVSLRLSNGAFVPSNGASRLSHSRLRMTSKVDTLAAYQEKIGVKTAAAASKAASSSNIAAPTESLPTNAVVPPVIVETPPPVEIVQKTHSVVMEQVTTATTNHGAGSDPISSWWNQITSPLRHVGDPFEKIKIPADLKNVDLNKELKNVDIKASVQRFSVPDFKSLSVPSVSVPDIKSVRVPDFKSIDLSNLQLPTPPERPEAPGVIMADGARMPTLFDIFGKPNVSGWKMPSSFSLSGILDSLHVSEFGAWYLAGFLLVAWQMQVQSTKDVYQKKLLEAETKARQAAEAASIAAEGATLTKTLATKKKKVPAKSTETILSESQQEALRLEKEEMKKQVEMLQQETEALKRQLKEANKAGAAADTVVNGANAPPTVTAPKLVEPMDAETNAQVLEIIKEQDKTNAAAKVATKAAPKKTAKKKAEPKKTSVKKVAPKKERVTARKEANVAVMEPIVEVETEILEVKPIGSDEVFFANMTVVEEETKPKKAAAKKSTPMKKVESKKVVEAVTATSDNPWKSLSPSALKRKTVKDISAYLTERNIQATDEAGKPLKKAELLDKVMALK